MPEEIKVVVLRVFPINRRHQRMATAELTLANKATDMKFPINRRHQRLATFQLLCDLHHGHRFFQSIGATKDWQL